MIKKWFENIWYHYKWFIITGFFAVVVLFITIAQCATKPKYDLSVVVAMTNTALSNEQIEVIKDNLLEYTEDVNKDGTINLNVLNCTFDENYADRNYVLSMRQKLQMTAMGEASALLYITNDHTFTYIDGIKEDVGGFFQDLNLKDKEGKAQNINKMSFYKPLKYKGKKMPENFYISKRIIKDTIIETDKNIDIYNKASDKMLKKIIKSIK